jgi:hypothetical protein
MQEEDNSMAIGKQLAGSEDPINSLLVVVNKLVDLESRADYQNGPVDEIQDSLRRIIGLLERLKK